MDLLRNLRAFVRTVETGSFAAVARDMRESHSAVTRRIAQLEAHFGARLFHRTTRSLSLTDDGQALIAIARQMLELEQTMEDGLRGPRASPRGVVRLGTTVSFGVFLVPRLPPLLERYPDLSLDLLVSDHPWDLIEARLDLALRFDIVRDTSLVVRHLYQGQRVMVAAPAYLERRGEPLTPQDLASHDCLSPEDMAGEWIVTGPDGPVTLPVRARFRANNNETLHAAALCGQGVALLPEAAVIDDIRSGRLRPVLAAYRPPPVPAYLVYPSRRHLPLRTRVVIDFLVEQVQSVRWGSDLADG